MSGKGREYALATGRFREAEFQWRSGNQFEDRIDATRPVPVNCRFCTNVTIALQSGQTTSKNRTQTIFVRIVNLDVRQIF